MFNLFQAAIIEGQTKTMTMIIHKKKIMITVIKRMLDQSKKLKMKIK